MLKTDIENKVIELIAKIKRMDRADLKISDEMDFVSELAIDSLDAVNLTTELGQVFNFNFGEEMEDLDALASFGGLVQLVERRGSVGA